jgi:hypothetical protein
MYLSILYANLLFAVIGSNYVVAQPPIRNVRTSPLSNLTGIDKPSLQEAEKVRPIESNVIRPFTHTVSQVYETYLVPAFNEFKEIWAEDLESYYESLKWVKKMHALALEHLKTQLRVTWKELQAALAHHQQERKKLLAREAADSTELPMLSSASLETQHKAQGRPVAATKLPTQSAALEQGKPKAKVHPTDFKPLMQIPATIPPTHSAALVPKESKQKPTEQAVALKPQQKGVNVTRIVTQLITHAVSQVHVYRTYFAKAFTACKELYTFASDRLYETFQAVKENYVQSQATRKESQAALQARAQVQQQRQRRNEGAARKATASTKLASIELPTQSAALTQEQPKPNAQAVDVQPLVQAATSNPPVPEATSKLPVQTVGPKSPTQPASTLYEQCKADFQPLTFTQKVEDGHWCMELPLATVVKIYFTKPPKQKASFWQSASFMKQKVVSFWHSDSLIEKYILAMGVLAAICNVPCIQRYFDRMEKDQALRLEKADAALRQERTDDALRREQADAALRQEQADAALRQEEADAALREETERKGAFFDAEIALYSNFLRQHCDNASEDQITKIAAEFFVYVQLCYRAKGPITSFEIAMNVYLCFLCSKLPHAPRKQIKRLAEELHECIRVHQTVE